MLVWESSSAARWSYARYPLHDPTGRRGGSCVGLCCGCLRFQYDVPAMSDDLADTPINHGTGRDDEAARQTYLLASAVDLPPAQQTWSWSQEQFMKHLEMEDPLSVVLRGLLYIEGAVRAVIATALPRPDALSIDRLDFPTKVRLMLALSILDESDVAPLLAMNALRNRLAHQLGTNATDEDVQAIVRSLSPTQKAMYDSQSQANSTFPDNLRLVVAVLVVELEGHIERLSVAQAQWKEILNRLLRLARPNK